MASVLDTADQAILAKTTGLACIIKYLQASKRVSGLALLGNYQARPVTRYATEGCFDRAG
jgi:hypothetical protein